MLTQLQSSFLSCFDSDARCGQYRTTACRHLGSLGAKLAIVDVQEDKLKQAVDSLEKEGLTAMYAAVNVADPEQWKAAVKSVVDKYGRVDVLVQAAGITGKTG